MIPVIHAPVHEQVAADDEYPIPAGGRRMEMEWDRVTEAFDAAARQLGWDAHVRVHPERRHVELVVPATRTDHVARTTLELYGAVADRIGMDEFMSIWVDFDVSR